MKENPWDHIVSKISNSLTRGGCLRRIQVDNDVLADDVIANQSAVSIALWGRYTLDQCTV